jgi:hypothetical protein
MGYGLWVMDCGLLDCWIVGVDLMKECVCAAHSQQAGSMVAAKDATVSSSCGCTNWDVCMYTYSSPFGSVPVWSGYNA